VAFATASRRLSRQSAHSSVNFQQIGERFTNGRGDPANERVQIAAMPVAP
jgi:hypothetical protein